MFLSLFFSLGEILTLKVSVCEVLFFFFFPRQKLENPLSCLLKEKSNIGTHVSVICGLELTWPPEAMTSEISPLAAEILGFLFAKLGFMNKRKPLAGGDDVGGKFFGVLCYLVREGSSYSRRIL